MSEHKDFRSDLENWAQIWAAMENDSQPEDSDAGNATSDKPQDTYYNYLDSEMDFGDYEYEGLIQEDRSANPIFPDSVGPDYKQPKPEWVDEHLLDEIEKLKNQLFRVENEMAKMGQGKKFSEKAMNYDGKSLMKEVESIRKRIETVSNHLGLGENDTPYDTKR